MENTTDPAALDPTASVETGSDPENPDQDPPTITPPPKPGERGLDPARLDADN